jgi:DNA polymerase elongation subunit (family B)
MRRLYGRVHIDVENTFIYRSCGLDGLIEVARTCRVPLHRAARASIGTIMTSLQLYQAVKDDILIPWKKRVPESFKSAWELLVADRGGFVFEPKVGIHDWVGEIDFASMYPTLMATRNISAETVLCGCCPDSKLRVPELGYNICEKRVGIVPKVLRLILKKRSDYKRLRNEAKDSKLKRVYDRRQEALKWILVTCFGYLGYKNARFGKVDAHIAVCSFARDALLRTARLAEERGFEIVHGIVDSLWLKKEGAYSKEYIDLCREIEREIGVPVGFEGRYRWIVFLPSKTRVGVPVLNRYYGVFEDGKIKVRGIEARRRDTPKFIRDAQIDMIRVLAKAHDSKEFLINIPKAMKVLKTYAERLLNREVSLEDLLITKQLSIEPYEYAHNVFQAIAVLQLVRAGLDVSAGQTIRYLIMDAFNKKLDRRIRVAELLDNRTNYDIKKYLELLLDAAATILRPFEYSGEKLYDLIVASQKQLGL